jgi:hypothetical protein
VAAVVPGTFRHATQTSEHCAQWLGAEAELWGPAQVELLRCDSGLTTFDVRFGTPEQISDYPDENVRVVVREDRKIFAVPVCDSGRTWNHRNRLLTITEILRVGHQPLPWECLLGSLCLWYPKDPPHLRWSWHHGLDAYLRIVQRHLWKEEYFRRTGLWVGEDAPHGERADGKPHPILTPELRIPS